MAESLKLQRSGLQFKIPEVDFTASRVQAQALNELSNNLDRMSSFFFQIAEQRAKIEGAEYGTENAPTKKQIEDAYSAGEEIPIGGDKFSVYGQSLRNAQLAVVYDELEYLSRNKIASVLKNYNTNVENFGTLSEKDRSALAPENLKEQLDEIVAGYASTLDETSPGFARKLRAKMGMTNNASYVTYADKYVGEINKLNKSVSIANSELVVNDVGTLIENWIDSDENAGLNLKKLIATEISGLAMQGLDTVGFNNRIKEAIKTTSKRIVVDELLRSGKPGKRFELLQEMSEGNFNKMPKKIGQAMALATEYGISRKDFVKQVQDGIDESKKLLKKQDDLEKAKNEEKINFAISDAISFLAEGDEDTANKIMAPFQTNKLKHTGEELISWEKISKAYEDNIINNFKDDANTIIKLRRKLFSIEEPLTLDELNDEFSNQKIGQATFFSMSNQIISLGNQQMGDARRYILDQTNHNPEIRITDPNGDDALKERVFREIMSNVFEAELEAKLDGKPFSAILTAQNLYQTKGKELIANRIKFNREDAIKVIQELATSPQLQNYDKELMERFAKATDQDLDGLLKDALDIAELVIADRKTFDKISLGIANAYPARLSRMLK